jgi:hypothetical protein
VVPRKKKKNREGQSLRRPLSVVSSLPFLCALYLNFISTFLSPDICVDTYMAHYHTHTLSTYQHSPHLTPISLFSRICFSVFCSLYIAFL